MNCRILEKNFYGLWSWQISAAHYCARGPMTRLFTTTLIMVNYYPITITYLSIYMLPAATCYCNMCIYNIYYDIYVYVYVCVMLWCAMCRMVYVYATLSSLALSSQPVCAWIGWHRCLTVCTYAHSTNYSITLIIIIITIIIHTIQYIYYNYTYTKYDICLHYTMSCEEAMLYTNSCIYYTMLYYVYIYSVPLWYDIWLCT